MEGIKKIVTRAVYGSRIQMFRNVIRIPALEMEPLKDVLGGTINGAKILCASIEEDDENGLRVKVETAFEVHLWYWSDKETKVYKADANSIDMIEFDKQRADRFRHEDVSAWIIEKPRLIDASVIRDAEGDVVAVQLEYALKAEIVGEASLNVMVYEDGEPKENSKKPVEIFNEATENPNRAVEPRNKVEIKYLQNL